jgi:hypothetical protein
MEALLEGARRASRDTLLLSPEALEHRIAAQAVLSRQCEGTLVDAWQASSAAERARIRALVRELKRAMVVYRIVALSGLRSTRALLQAVSASRRERHFALEA